MEIKNFESFDEWYEKAIQLLKDKPFGTALADESLLCFYYLENDNILCIELAEKDSIYNPSSEYDNQSSVHIDPRAWSENSWTSSTPEETKAPLIKPNFVKLNLKN